MGVRSSFPVGVPIMDFSRGSQKGFSIRGKSDEISFFPPETKKTTFSAKNVTAKCQISNSEGCQGYPLPALPTPIPVLVNIFRYRSSLPWISAFPFTLYCECMADVTIITKLYTMLFHLR